MEGRRGIGKPVIGFWYKRVGRENRQIRSFIILRRDVVLLELKLLSPH